MRLCVGLVAGAAFLAMLLLDTQGVVELAWMAALGRLGAWPQRVLVGAVVVLLAGGLLAARYRPRAVRRPARQRRPKQATAPAKVALKGAPAPGRTGRRPAAPGAAGPRRATPRPAKA